MCVCVPRVSTEVAGELFFRYIFYTCGEGIVKKSAIKIWTFPRPIIYYILYNRAGKSSCFDRVKLIGETLTLTQSNNIGIRYRGICTMYQVSNAYNLI